ncbi:MAG: single-stranded DNA-binding protein [Mycoplasmatales bacterium]
MVNNVVLVGRITKDPELRHSTSGSSVCNFSLAINRTFKNQAGEYDADFINCVAFNQTANLMEQYVGKGQLLSVQGRLQSRSYEDNTGRRVYVTEVVANNVSFLESRRTAASNNAEYQAPANYENSASDTTPTFEANDVSIDDDDLPF